MNALKALLPQRKKEAWPTLYEEAHDMMQVSMLMYAVADLRQSRKLELPLTPKALLEECGADELDDLCKASIAQQLQESNNAVELVKFDDTHSERELVYGIALNHDQQRITVGFRGSVTVKDFQTDATAVVATVANPVTNRILSSTTMGIHHGFATYLLSAEGTSSITTKSTNSKCLEILAQVQDLLQQYPDYRIYVSGHSLGGALATLWSVYAAAKFQDKTITCISVASPKVGTLSFRRAVHDLTNLRCLRISNRYDLVTLLPDIGTWSCLYITACQSRMYRHVGVELQLRPRSYHLGRAEDANVHYCQVWHRDLAQQLQNSLAVITTLLCCCRGHDYLLYHSCAEYLQRLQQHEAPLQSLYLDDFYHQN